MAEQPVRKVFVEEIKEGDRVRSVFLVKYKATPVKRNGEPYINLNLVDRTGEIEGKVWDNARELDKVFAKNDFIAVEGTANLYQGRLQLRVDAVARVDDSKVEIADFLPVVHGDVEQMWQEMLGCLRSVGNADLRRVVDVFVADADLVAAFKRAPAAKEIHHAYIGGLLEHSLAMMRIADRICPQYPFADRDLVVVGCFLHDIGKTRELSFDRAFDYSDGGRLVGHIVMGAELVGEKIAAAGGVPAALEVHLKHLVLAHHGELEFGSPKRPKTVEAMLLSMIDDLDAKMNSFRTIFEREPGDAWTAFQKYYDRYLFKGKPYPPAEAVPPGRDGAVEGMAATPDPAPAARRVPGPKAQDLKFKPFAQMALLGEKKDGGKGR